MEHWHHWGNFSKYKGHSKDLILILKGHLLTYGVCLNVFLARVIVNKKDFHFLIPTQIPHLAAVLSILRVDQVFKEMFPCPCS